MALTTTDYEVNPFPLQDDRPELPAPPDVAITPCDPWPRPYYLENGLRRVAPYHFTYNTYCKARWRGREILEIFASEFRDRTKEYYQKAIEGGQIVINGEPCLDVHTKVKNGDIVSHTLHRHEPPVTAQPVRVIFEDHDMIVIDKPAGVPVHPAGRYNYNSVVEIMRAERHHMFNPLPCNRLDRLTSGVMFIGKTSQKAEVISAKLRERTMQKEYVARVKGRFPDGDGWDGDPMRGGVVKCDEAILQISPILGLNRARASGRTAKTLFRRIAYYPSRTQPQAQSQPSVPMAVDTETKQAVAQPAPPTSGTEDDGYSVVHCLPLTGRTHQIRVHLQFLGHPISNDPIYSNRRVFGPDLGKHDATGEDDAGIMERLSKMGKTEVADAYSYSKDDPKSAPPSASALVDQTQQITLSDLKVLDQQQQSSSAAPSSTATPKPPPPVPPYFKPLHQTLHAGPMPTAPDLPNVPLPHATMSELDTLAGSTNNSESDPLYAAYVLAHDEAVADYNKRRGEKLTGEVCDVCLTPLYSDPGPQELGIYLHALAYADMGGEWRFRSSMPEWAKPPRRVDDAGREVIVDGPREVDEWIHDGSGAEEIDPDLEKEKEKEACETGNRKNKEW